MVNSKVEKAIQRQYTPSDDRELPLVQIAGLPSNNRFTMTSTRGRYVIRQLRSACDALKTELPEFVESMSQLSDSLNVLQAVTAELEKVQLEISQLPKEKAKQVAHIKAGLDKLLDLPAKNKVATHPQLIPKEGPVSVQQVATAISRSVAFVKKEIPMALAEVGFTKTGAKLYARKEVEEYYATRVTAKNRTEPITIDWSRRP